MPNLIGQSLGRYHILEQLGEGGMATVYKAYDTRSIKKVVVKVIRADKYYGEARLIAKKRFEREIILLAKLTHPNIIRILDYGEYYGEPYFVMPLLLEGTLKQRTGKPIPWEEVVRTLFPIGDALHVAHLNGIVHRDVKPSNILYKNGQPILSDFGIAITNDNYGIVDSSNKNVIVGTPEYMSPEQKLGKELDLRSDIYSFGIVFYEMLTGKRQVYALGDTTYENAVERDLNETQIIPPREIIKEIPEDLNKALVKALAYNKEDRFRNMKELLIELEKIQQTEGAFSKEKAFSQHKNRTKKTLWFRITKLFTQSRNLFSKDYFSHSWRRFRIIRFILLLIITLVIYSGIRYFIDQRYFITGHKAFENADCTEAVQNYDHIINAWRLLNIGGYDHLATMERAECIFFQEAVEEQQTGDYSAALVTYTHFINSYGESGLVEAARLKSASLFEQPSAAMLASQESCGMIRTFIEKDVFPQPDINLPNLYFACGNFFETSNDMQNSYNMYVDLLSQYPDYSQSAKVEISLLANPISCEKITSLQSMDAIAGRVNFIPSLYYHCGQMYEKDSDWINAISMYETFLDKYPDDTLAKDVETALAHLIVAQAKAGGAGKMPEPEQSGNTSSSITEIIIQNDSPEELRIVFSGPESHIEKLASCSLCTNFIDIGPTDCPQKGPIGRYTLKPGQYDIVVESISSNEITPWSGNWNLISGEEYSSCFFIVTKTVP